MNHRCLLFQHQSDFSLTHWAVTQVSSKSEPTLNKVSRHLSSLGDRFKLFDKYRASLALDPETLQSFFDILVEITLCTARAIKSFRRNDIQHYLASWTKLDEEFKSNIDNLEERLDLLHKLVEAQSIQKLLHRTQPELLHQMEELQLNANEAPEAVRCSTIAHQRNHGFFGRSVELEDVTAAFDKQSKIRSVALWGSGGIGKSQIAIEFAHRRWESGTSVILWIASETEAEIASSFNDAARNLDLGGYSENNTPDKNRHLVLQWLQSTSKSPSTAYEGRKQMLTDSETNWLLIFDNVEDEEKLLANLPKVGRGDILITCRSELLAESLESSMQVAIVEVPPFSNDETTQLILQILDKTPTSVKHDELQATRTLSEQLGGLALAVDIVAKNMKTSRRFKSVVDFLPYYEKNRRSLNKRKGARKSSYTKDLDTVWEIAFASLDTEDQPEADAAKLLRLLCFVAPEAIPEFFQPEDVMFPEDWSFLGDDERFVYGAHGFGICGQEMLTCNVFVDSEMRSSRCAICL